MWMRMSGLPGWCGMGIELGISEGSGGETKGNAIGNGKRIA